MTLRSTLMQRTALKMDINILQFVNDNWGCESSMDMLHKKTSRKIHGKKKKSSVAEENCRSDVKICITEVLSCLLYYWLTPYNLTSKKKWQRVSYVYKHLEQTKQYLPFLMNLFFNQKLILYRIFCPSYTWIRLYLFHLVGFSEEKIMMLRSKMK